jgi:chemotaxis protein CheX
MKSEYIQPFIEALAKVLEQSTGSPVKRNPVSVRSSPMTTMGVASIIGITGSCEGRAILDMSRQTACQLAAVMSGEPAGGYDLMVSSTINELNNMISGQAVSALVNKGLRLDINPPTLFTGSDMDIANSGMEIVTIPVETSAGQVVLNLSLRAKP